MKKAIAIDFDGCLSTNKFPAVGNPNWEVINRAKREQQAGAGLILWTCREGQLLSDALDACKEWGLTFDAVNESLPDWVETFGTKPRKVGASEYWDDRAVRIPPCPGVSVGNKYEMTDITKVFEGRTLHRIRALQQFDDVDIGDLGGWIEKTGNLSQDGSAWVSEDAMVYDDAMVSENARVGGHARVYNKAMIYGHAQVCDSAQVYGEVHVCDDAGVFANAAAFDRARIYNDAVVCGDAGVGGSASIGADMYVTGGRWTRSPLYIRGTSFSFNVASDKLVCFGDELRTWSGWKAYCEAHKDDDSIGEFLQHWTCESD